MLESLVEQQKVIRLWIFNNDCLTNSTYSKWDLLKSINNILRPYKEITKTANKEEKCIFEVFPL